MDKSQLPLYGLSPQSYVWKTGMSQWQEARYFPELMELLQPGGAPYPFGYVPSGKDRIGAGLLAIFLGGFGIHYFYVGKVTAGVLTILLSLITCGIWTLIMFIQGIVMLTMTQEQFDQKYVYNDATMPIF